MSKEAQFEQVVKVDSVKVNKEDVRDLSVTDIIITEYSPDSVHRIIKTTTIRRCNDIERTQRDSTVIQSKDSLKSHEMVQNKSSPDKASQAISTTTIIIIISIIILSTILVIKFFLR